MGYELLETVRGLLEAAGLRTVEEYPGLERPEIDAPTAALGLQELDAMEGIVWFTVRILSPRILGGWCCQIHGARASAALNAGGMTCRTEEMEYRSGSDCFCVTVRASMPVAVCEDRWAAGARWRIRCGDELQEGVESFRAVRRQGRRVVGAFCQSGPVAVTPGSGGWELELVQWITREPEEPAEPFVLTVREGDREQRYTGCCWNETHYVHTQRGLCLTRRGFALAREGNEDG